MQNLTEEEKDELNELTKQLAARMARLLASGQPTCGTHWVLPRGSKDEVKAILKLAYGEDYGT